MIRRCAIVVALPVLLALASCGGEDTVNMENAEREIATGFARQSEDAVVSGVDCPDDVSAKIGTRTSCVMTLENGTELDVDVSVVGDDGRIRWTTVGGSVPDEVVEQEASRALTESVGVAPDLVDCPDRVAIGKGRTTRCELRSGATVYGATITMTSDDGAFDVEVDEQPSG